MGCGVGGSGRRRELGGSFGRMGRGGGRGLDMIEVEVVRELK